MDVQISYAQYAWKARCQRLPDPVTFMPLVISMTWCRLMQRNGKVKRVIFRFFHFIDSATNFHVAIPYHQGTTEGLIGAFPTAWILGS
jgi:hypothetical protein